MKTVTLTGRFDPITQSELETITGWRKRGYSVTAAVTGEGVLPIEKRVQLVQAAIRPWRHVSIAKEKDRTEKAIDITDGKQEEHVRNGYFCRAATGTKTLLLENGWYLNEVVHAQCSPHRAAHSISVAEVCRDLAKANGVDELLAWRMGMLHDITKRMNDDEGRKILAVYEPDKLTQNVKIWHSYTAVYWLKQEMGLYDPRILSAIHCHTVGHGITKLDWILYVADKCEPTRGYDSSRELAMARKNLKAAAQLVYEEAESYREGREGKE